MLEDRHRRRLILLSQLALAGYWIALFVGTHLPPAATPLPARVADKIMHVAAYAGLSFLLSTVWQLAGGHLAWRQLKWVWLTVVVYGMVDELTQPYVRRDASILDWLADAAGAALGIVAFVWMRQKLIGRSPLDQ